MTLDHFPSLAEVKTICDYLQSCKGPSESHGRHKSPGVEIVPEEHKRISPWPAALEALMLMIARGTADTGGWRYGLQYCTITEEEAWTLYDAFIGKRFEDKSAQSIIERVAANCGKADNGDRGRSNELHAPSGPKV